MRQRLGTMSLVVLLACGGADGLDEDPFVDAGKAVFRVEYVDDPAQGPELAAQVCPDALARSFSTLIKGWDLDAWRIVCE